MLDDAYKAFKTYRCRIDLSNDPDWVEIWSDANVRNGAVIFVRKTLKKTSLMERLYMGNFIYNILNNKISVFTWIRSKICEYIKTKAERKDDFLQ